MKRSSRASLGISVAVLLLVLAASSCVQDISRSVPGVNVIPPGGPSASPIPMPVPCPAHLSQLTASAPAAGVTRAMVPGSPVVAIGCWYPVLGSKRARPRLTITGGLGLQRLVRLLNSLPRPFQPGTYFCPMDRGNGVSFGFHYADGSAPQVVTIRLSGCSAASNGQKADWLDPALRRFLARLAPHR